MNEFEWLRQTRALREPVTPRRDLWPELDAAIDASRATAPMADKPSRRGHGLLLAASFAGVALFTGSVVMQMRMQPVTSNTASATSDIARWRPADPRLAGAAVELDAANMELRQAMEQAPDSRALQRLLYRTQKQQSQLRQMEHQAG